MRIAVTSQNFRTITGHAGKTRRFLVYELAADAEPEEVERIDLPRGMALHDYHGDDHPLYGLGLDAIVTGGAGRGFIQRLSRYGVKVLPTAETDIAAALRALVQGKALPTPTPHTH